MMERNIILIIVSGLVAALTYFVKDAKNSKFAKKWPKVYKISNKVLVPVYVIAFLLSIYFTVNDNRDSDRAKSDLKDNFDSVKIQLNVEKELLSSTKKSIDSIQRDLIKLKSYSAKNDSTLNLFAALALKKYPKLDSIQALRKLYRDININIKNDIINAPNAQIATINQVGNNYVTTSIPEITIKGRWISIDKRIDSTSTATKRIQFNRYERLLSESKVSYKDVYIHQFELDYSTLLMRNRIVIIVHNKEIINADIFHVGSVKNGKGKITDPGRHNSFYYCVIGQPENGKYLFTFFTKREILGFPKVEIVE